MEVIPPHQVQLRGLTRQINETTWVDHEYVAPSKSVSAMDIENA